MKDISNKEAEVPKAYYILDIDKDDGGSGAKFWSFFISLFEFRESFRYYTRNVPRLSPRHYAVIMFILDRTLGWGKIWEKINAKHITNGVRNVSVGFNLSDRTVYRTIKELRSMGLISIINLEHNYRLISLSQYFGFLTDADVKLFIRNGLDMDELMTEMREGPEILFRCTDRFSAEPKLNEQTYKRLNIKGKTKRERLKDQLRQAKVGGC